VYADLEVVLAVSCDAGCEHEGPFIEEQFCVGVGLADCSVDLACRGLGFADDEWASGCWLDYGEVGIAWSAASLGGV
jgi:hypothetical protein